MGTLVLVMPATSALFHRAGCTGWSYWMTTALALGSWWW